MYSSRMRTVHCSGRLLGGGVSVQRVGCPPGGVCPEGAGVSAQGGVHLPLWTDRHL